MYLLNSSNVNSFIFCIATDLNCFSFLFIVIDFDVFNFITYILIAFDYLNAGLLLSIDILFCWTVEPKAEDLTP